MIPVSEKRINRAMIVRRMARGRVGIKKNRGKRASEKRGIEPSDPVERGSAKVARA